MPQRNKTGTVRSNPTRTRAPTNMRAPTQEQIMIPSVPIAEQAAAPRAGGRGLTALFRGLLDSWLAHHQRLADLGISADL